MQMIKIHIPDPTESAKAFGALIRRGRVDCYRDQIYVVPEPALDVIRGMGITFQELGRGGLDYADPVEPLCPTTS